MRSREMWSFINVPPNVRNEYPVKDTWYFRATRNFSNHLVQVLHFADEETWPKRDVGNVTQHLGAEQGQEADSLDEVLEQPGRGSSSPIWMCLKKDWLYTTWCLLQRTGWHGTDLDLDPSCVTLGSYSAALSLRSSSVPHRGMASVHQEQALW